MSDFLWELGELAHCGGDIRQRVFALPDMPDRVGYRLRGQSRAMAPAMWRSTST